MSRTDLCVVTGEFILCHCFHSARAYTRRGKRASAHVRMSSGRAAAGSPARYPTRYLAWGTTHPQSSGHTECSGAGYGEGKALVVPVQIQRHQRVQSMTNGSAYSKPSTYRIWEKGTLDAKWVEWFDGLAVTPQPNDETVLAGTVADQPALHGILTKIRDLGLPLLTVERMENE